MRNFIPKPSTIPYGDKTIYAILLPAGPYFLGSSVLDALDYKGVPTLARHCPERVKAPFRTSGGVQDVNWISANDVIRLANARLSTHPDFRRWFTRQCLPWSRMLPQEDARQYAKQQLIRELEELVQKYDSFALTVVNNTISTHGQDRTP